MDESEYLWVTPAHVAKRDKITKQAVTKSVRKLVDAHDLPVQRDGRGRVTKFCLAHYDHLLERFGNSEKLAADRLSSETPLLDQPDKPRAGSPVNPDSRDEALRQEAWLKLRRSQLQMEEEVGSLVQRDTLEQALKSCAQEINLLVSRLPNQSDALAQAIAREGESGVRVALRKVAFNLNTAIADRLAEVFEAAPETDEMSDELPAQQDLSV
ncbi:MAG: hypothetical protein NXI02_12380 [Rhodobacteraceae bacterium]|nr:hypothetical protein [Paracoccaceae bacterium]